MIWKPSNVNDDLWLSCVDRWKLSKSVCCRRTGLSENNFLKIGLWNDFTCLCSAPHFGSRRRSEFDSFWVLISLWQWLYRKCCPGFQLQHKRGRLQTAVFFVHLSRSLLPDVRTVVSLVTRSSWVCYVSLCAKSFHLVRFLFTFLFVLHRNSPPRKLSLHSITIFLAFPLPLNF